MSKPHGPLPDDVREALRRGTIFDAIKLLTRSGGISLKDAKDLIDAEMGRSQTGAPGRAQGHAPPGAVHPLAVGWPPAATEALRRGNKIEAIRLVRQHTGIGLKEAKDAVDAHEQNLVPTVEALSPRNGLSPGEVPRTSGLLWWLVILGVIAGGVLYHFFLRDPG